VSTCRLVIDVGGTNIRFGALDSFSSIKMIDVFRCRDFVNLEESVSNYCQKRSITPTQLMLAVACPVDKDTVSLTNNPWMFSKKRIVARFGLERLTVINDFMAQSLASLSLTHSGCRTLQPGNPDPRSPILVVGPGTGLGMGGALMDQGGGLTLLASEGGHVAAVAQTEMEWKIIQYLRSKLGFHVSAERLVSGAGLVSIYQAICVVKGLPFASVEPQDIAETRDSDPVAREALRYFSEFLGTVTADACLTMGAKGGVFLAGGVIPKLGEAFDADAFLDRFNAKGRLSGFIADVPVSVIENSEAALIGMAQFFDSPELQAFSLLD
jgi:glucokinase